MNNMLFDKSSTKENNLPVKIAYTNDMLNFIKWSLCGVYSFMSFIISDSMIIRSETVVPVG